MRWFLLTGRRSLVAACLAAGVFAALLAAARLAPGGGMVNLVTGDPLETLFQALVAATVTGVTLVLTLNQVVLSQELGALADQRGRLQGSLDFRRDVDDYLRDGVSPAEPAAFLRHLLAGLTERAQALERRTDGIDGAEGCAGFARDLATRARNLRDRLEGRRFGDFRMLSAALQFAYSRHIHRARELRRDPRLPLSDDHREALDDLVRGLTFYGAVREHFKTLYFERDLIDLSRSLLVAALPSLVIAITFLLYFEPSTYGHTVLTLSASVWLLSLGITLSVTPFVLLLAYILRIATVTRRTLAAGPFVLDGG